MKKVTLEKTDTCLTYVLKRLGLDPYLCNYESITDHFTEYKFASFRKQMTEGDILLWDRDLNQEWLPWHISETGQITWRSIPIGFHFGIYEGDKLFSDCTRLVTPPHPTIRLRDMSQLKKNPDWVLRYNEN